MGYSFSARERSRVVQTLSEQEWDLLVIGGGITGAGIALDAQTRGIQTALIEMQDFAAGTSSRSTKLVHGGLRYLKQLEFGLVAEVGRERAIVYENAPHVTTPEWMLLPIVRGGTYGKWAASFGVYLYDRLAGVKKSERRKMLNAEETLAKEPLLRKEGLKGSCIYVEYRTDDARLTLEVLKEAVAQGALAVNYVKATDFLYRDGKLIGVKAMDLLQRRELVIKARKIVNAAGPWVDFLREKDGSKQGKTLHWTKGVHIVVDQSRFPLRHAVYFDTPDGRMVFAIPRDGKTYIGTTDTDYHEDLEHPRITVEDRDYLLRAVNRMFPSLGLTPHDVESGWAGIRPLIHEAGKSPSEISRKDEMFRSDSGLITIAGGKLTGYRKMAQKVVDLVASELEAETKQNFGPCRTADLPLSGGKFGGSAHYPAFLKEQIQAGMEWGLAREEAEKLVRRYGSNVGLVYDIVKKRSEEAASFGLPPDVFAALVYGVEHEMTATPSDFFIRRTSAMFFDIDWVRRWKEPVTSAMAHLLGWDEETTEQHRRNLEQRLTEATEVV
ncbi:FAD-dependent oxidoreductase [Polycladomyces sp. WAk]|uniref:Glycerol-3-phosphate dehydrogenase n=1 Tax=Polycladomyces zharkentensis TaxID=2807616 RepID=A0ABS2WK46_9BACL|nr:FAD-dependent oxidoreductase [Polycladomyces sp. WAk]MBN2909848.1 FAD-dependent oxidoreductase [Polycladomyces sp. WAk]